METNKQESNRPVTYWIGEGAGWLLRHVVSGLAATGVTPNMFTFLGLAVNTWAATLFAYGRFRQAAVVLFLAIFWNAPLEEFANPIHPPNPAKAPWYFLGLQELVSYSAFWGGVVVPGVLVAGLVLLPYLDRQRRGVGRWFAPERKLATTLFTIGLVVAIVLTVIGSVFRGPNWSWQEPWKQPPAMTEGR